MKEVSVSLRQLLSKSFKTLCSSWGSIAEDTLLHCKKILPHNSTITLRGLYLPTDLSLIQDWINGEYNTAGFPLQNLWPELLQTYTDIQQSDYAQAFMCAREGLPVCLIDVHQVLKHEISLTYTAGEGDYIIRLLLDPKEKNSRHLYVNLLQLSLEYFFMYKEVERIIVEADVEDYPDSQLAGQAGFRLLQKINKFPYTQAIYLCTRDTFLKD